jgi:tRNA nucleotidyltransferase/poly(A) polymerase
MNDNNATVLNILKSVGEVAQRHNIKAYAVGGFARDYALKRKTNDVDICFESDFKRVLDFCRKKYDATAEHFGEFGTARVTLNNGIKLDFARCRGEIYLKPAALPKVFPSDLKDDLFRRDFTCNARAVSVWPSEFLKSYDYFGAADAIKGRYIEILHDKSFIDDPTRVFRALRFAGRLNWELAKNTEIKLKEAVKQNFLALLSRERIRQELLKILEEPGAKRIFGLLKKYDALKFIYPRLKWNDKILKVKDTRGKILILALSLGGKGGAFLEALRLVRTDYMENRFLWETFINKKSPLKELTARQKKILRLFVPDFALKKSFLTGGVLRQAGFSGAEITAKLDKLRALQWRGKIKNKRQSLKLLKEGL